jgi:hypothetical protein
MQAARSDARRFRILMQFPEKEACKGLASAGQFS